MLTELGNDLKNILLAGIGAVAVTAEKSSEIISELIKKGEITVEQGRALNEEIKNKVKDAVEERKAARAEKAAASVNVEQMTREEREALRRKLEELDAMEVSGEAAADEDADMDESAAAQSAEEDEK